MRKQRQKGYTLVEVLVTVIILVVGILGMAALQTTGIRFAHSAYLRSQMTFLADDIIDRMRANRPSGANYADYEQYKIDDDDPFDDIPAVSELSTDCATSACSVIQMADYDKAQWKETFEDRLPGGDTTNVSIAVSATSRPADILVTITLQDAIGIDERDEDDIENMQFNFFTQI